MNFEREQADTELAPYYDDLGADGLKAYWEKKNVETIDGLPTGLFED